MKALKEGFYEIIPRHINKTFNELDIKVKKMKYIFLFKYLDIFKILNNIILIMILL